MSTTIKYSVPDQGPDVFTCESSWNPVGSGALFAVADAAQDWCDCHDGLRDSWPIVFALHSLLDGTEIGRFKVEREDRPEFYGHALDAAANALVEIRDEAI